MTQKYARTDLPFQLGVIPKLTDEQLAAAAKFNHYEAYLETHPDEKVWADRAVAQVLVFDVWAAKFKMMNLCNYAERKRCWAEQEKVRQARERGEGAKLKRRPDQWDILTKI